jgi:hypothetical protein
MPINFRCGRLLLLGLLFFEPRAYGQTDEIQVYDAEIVSQGHWNLTWHNNYTPSGRELPDFTGGVVPDHTLNGVPEWAYGVRDWFELGAYVPIYSLTGGRQLLFDGVKLRTLFVVPHAAERTFFYGLNFEYSYNRPQWDTHRYSGEIRPIVGVHLGHIDLIVNPIFDTEYNGPSNLDFAPAARVAYNFSERLALALEQYSDFGPVKHFAPTSQQDQTLFAVVDLGTSSNGIEFGVGHGFTAASDKVVIKLMLMHDF